MLPLGILLRLLDRLVFHERLNLVFQLEGCDQIGLIFRRQFLPFVEIAVSRPGCCLHRVELERAILQRAMRQPGERRS